MKKGEIKEYVEDKGYIRVNVILEIAGSPKKHVKKTMDGVVKKIEDEQGVIILDKELGEPEDNGEGVYGAYCECDLLLENLYKLSWLAFNYTPASIELIEPTKLKLTQKQSDEFFGDLLARLHEYNTHQVKVSNKNIGLQKNLNALLRNASMALLETPKNAGEIAKPLGVKKKDIEPVLKKIEEDGKIKKEGDKYKRA